MEVFDPLIKKALENATPTTIVFVLIFASFIYALSQANIIYDFIDKLSQREFSRLKELLVDENISKTAKISLRNKIELIAYQRITGIKINNIYLQEQVIHYYQLAKGRLKYSDFKRAASFLRIDENDILIIRPPYWYEKIAHVYWTVSSIFIFVILSLVFTTFIYFSMPIWTRLTLLIFIIGFGAIFFTFLYQASLLPAAKRIRNEIENNPFIVKRNKAAMKARQINSEAAYHPLSHLSESERQSRIKQVLGAWRNDSEIDDIFTEIDRVRHQEGGKHINSFDD